MQRTDETSKSDNYTRVAYRREKSTEKTTLTGNGDIRTSKQLYKCSVKPGKILKYIHKMGPLQGNFARPVIHPATGTFHPGKLDFALIWCKNTSFQRRFQKNCRWTKKIATDRGPNTYCTV